MNKLHTVRPETDSLERPICQEIPYASLNMVAETVDGKLYTPQEQRYLMPWRVRRSEGSLIRFFNSAAVVLEVDGNSTSLNANLTRTLSYLTSQDSATNECLSVQLRHTSYWLRTKCAKCSHFRPEHLILAANA